MGKVLRNHKKLVKMARKMRTSEETKQGVALFKSKRWLYNNWRIRVKVAQREAVAKRYAEMKRHNKMAETLPGIS